MESFVIHPSSTLPKINLEPRLGIFEMSGKSIPKNPDEFYFPVFRWFDEYLDDPNEYTNLSLSFEYLNTASHKCLAIICNKLNKVVDQDLFVKIIWNYDEIDEDMLEVGEELEESCPNIAFEYISHAEQ